MFSIDRPKIPAPQSQKLGSSGYHHLEREGGTRARAHTHTVVKCKMGGSGESKFRKQDSGQREDIPSKETNTFYQKENKVTKKDKKSVCETRIFFFKQKLKTRNG